MICIPPDLTNRSNQELALRWRNLEPQVSSAADHGSWVTGRVSNKPSVLWGRAARTLQPSPTDATQVNPILHVVQTNPGDSVNARSGQQF